MVKSKNVDIDEKQLNAKTCAFVVGLSKDKGVVALQTYPKSLDQHRFIKFLEELRRIYGKQAIALYIDNASFHKANSVKEYAGKHQIELIFSPVYSP